MPETQSKPPAPYLPWRTFFNSLETFSQGIPPRIDRTIWRQSGLMQGLIFSAYRFFGLIDDKNQPTGMLVVLVEKTGEERPIVMAELLKHSYPDVMAHDLTTLTQPMLDELIEKYNVSGATKKKAITFFLQAAKYSRVQLSPFIQVRNTSGTRRRRAGQPRVNGEDALNMADGFTAHLGTERSIELKSGGTVTVKVSVDFLSMSPEDREFVFGLVDQLKSYEPKSTFPLRPVAGGIK